MLIIVSGPSTIGKSRLVDLARSSLGFDVVVPYTTRTIREDEADGREYHYVDRLVFRDLIRSRALFEWDYTLHNYYGCPQAIGLAAEREYPTIMHALARMAVRISMRLPNVTLVFLRPSDEGTLTERLTRRQYSEEESVLRRAHWIEEIEHAPLFDVIVESGENLSDVQSVRLLKEVGTRYGGC